MSACFMCPRECGADREAGQIGFCSADNHIRIARYAKHMWEEPFLSGKNGSGTIFFSGCNMQCIFCQNHVISHLHYGKDVTQNELKTIILSLAEQGVHNINLVTPTHYVGYLLPVLTEVKPKVNVPFVYNTGGYEKVETLKKLDGIIDVYLPDYKYSSTTLAGQYSAAPDYPDVAKSALVEMYRQTGKPVFDDDGMLQKGLVIRHLVLPGCRKDSLQVLQDLDSLLPRDGFLLSLMSQYTPEFAKDSEFANLRRKITAFEYNSVLDVAEKMGFLGCRQQRSSSDVGYVPDFQKDTITTQ